MSASALFFLPETHHRALPATIEEMEKAEGVKINLEKVIFFLNILFHQEVCWAPCGIRCCQGKNTDIRVSHK